MSSEPVASKRFCSADGKLWNTSRTLGRLRSSNGINFGRILISAAGTTPTTEFVRIFLLRAGGTLDRAVQARQNLLSLRQKDLASWGERHVALAAI